ncbi:MAG: helix-turn-helix transcriptional regulator [Erysipelotrichales bacterium]|nr:helix-turn-helix transcriptional regulator [Erysipelotrichales bacterium]
MNTKKIGLFISSCRKEKGLTQKQLADYIGVSDKSVSKWERGINLPESSLFIPLCETLDIQVQELLLGEHIEKNELLNKSNELLVDLSQQQNLESFTFLKFTIFFLLLPLILICIGRIPDLVENLPFLRLYAPFTLIWGLIKIIESLINKKAYFGYFLVTSLSLFLLYLHD